LDDVKQSDKNVAEANRLIGAAQVLDASVRVSRSTSSNNALINSQRKRRSDFKKLLYGRW